MKVLGFFALVVGVFAASCSQPVGHSGAPGSRAAVSTASDLPDLIISHIAVNRIDDRSIIFVTTATNVGPARTTEPISVQGFLSDDPILDAGDVSLGSFSSQFGATLATGTSVVIGSDAVLPPHKNVPQYLIVRVDPQNEVAEGSEDNNVKSLQVLPLMPDLEVTNVKLNLLNETLISWVATVSNVGLAPIDMASISVAGFLSDDLVRSADDTPVGTIGAGRSGALAPGESINVGTSAAVGPHGTTPLFLLVQAASLGTTGEREGSNNLGSVQIQPASAPDLALGGSNFLRLRLDSAFNYHVMVKNFGSSNADISRSEFQAYVYDGAPGAGIRSLDAGRFKISPNTRGLEELAPGQILTADCFVSYQDPWFRPDVDQYMQWNIDINNSIPELEKDKNQIYVLIHRAGEPFPPVVNF